MRPLATSILNSANEPRTLWEDTASPAPETGSLFEEIDTETLVVGAGYTGLSTALHIAQQKGDVTVAEASSVGYGGSGRNAGHCTPTFQHVTLASVRKRLGPVWGERAIAMQTSAAAYVFDLIRSEAIDCDACMNGFLQLAHLPSAMSLLSARCAEYSEIGMRGRMISAEEVEALTGSPLYFGGWLLESAGHLNPLSYARGLAKSAIKYGARVYTNTPVVSMAANGRRWRATTPNGVINADRVMFSTGAYTGQVWPGLRNSFLLAQVACLASYPLADKYRGIVLPKNNHVLDTRGDFTNFRLDREGRLITSVFVEGRRGGDPESTMNRLSDLFERLLPGVPRLSWEYYWFGKVDLHPTTFPQFMELAPGVTAILGYSSRGVPTATVMGREMARYALGANPTELSVQLTKMRSVPQFLHLAPRILLPYYRMKDAFGSWLGRSRPGTRVEDIL